MEESAVRPLSQSFDLGNQLSFILVQGGVEMFPVIELEMTSELHQTSRLGQAKMLGYQEIENDLVSGEELPGLVVAADRCSRPQRQWRRPSCSRTGHG